MSKENIVRYTLEEARTLKGETDWAWLAAQEAAGIEPGPDEDDFEVDWSSARLVVPEVKGAVSLRLDADVLAYFRAQGKGYQTRINAVLRAYKDAAQKRG